MITVAILINGQPIMARSAVNVGKIRSKKYTTYQLDDGSEVIHEESAGAVALAMKMLQTIKEVKRRG